MSPTRLEWLLMLSLRQMKDAHREGRKANDVGQWPNSCPYKEGSARFWSWMRGWKEGDRAGQPATE